MQHCVITILAVASAVKQKKRTDQKYDSAAPVSPSGLKQASQSVSGFVMNTMQDDSIHAPHKMQPSTVRMTKAQ